MLGTFPRSSAEKYMNPHRGRFGALGSLFDLERGVSQICHKCIEPGVLESTVGIHVVFCFLSLESGLVVVRHLLKHRTRHFVQVVPSEGEIFVKMF